MAGFAARTIRATRRPKSGLSIVTKASGLQSSTACAVCAIRRLRARYCGSTSQMPMRLSSSIGNRL